MSQNAESDEVVEVTEFSKLTLDEFCWTPTPFLFCSIQFLCGKQGGGKSSSPSPQFYYCQNSWKDEWLLTPDQVPSIGVIEEYGLEKFPFWIDLVCLLSISAQWYKKGRIWLQFDIAPTRSRSRDNVLSVSGHNSRNMKFMTEMLSNKRGESEVSDKCRGPNFRWDFTLIITVTNTFLTDRE